MGAPGRGEQRAWGRRKKGRGHGGRCAHYMAAPTLSMVVRAVQYVLVGRRQEGQPGATLEHELEDDAVSSVLSWERAWEGRVQGGRVPGVSSGEWK